MCREWEGRDSKVILHHCSKLYTKADVIFQSGLPLVYRDTAVSLRVGASPSRFWTLYCKMHLFPDVLMQSLFSPLSTVASTRRRWQTIVNTDLALCTVLLKQGPGNRMSCFDLYIQHILHSASGAGSHCCYDAAGHLLYSQDALGGSMPARAHPGGLAPFTGEFFSTGGSIQ